MKTALRLFLVFSALSSIVIAAGCDGDDGDGTTTTTTTTTTTSGGGMGGMGGMGGSGGTGGSTAMMVPELGAQIDRIGRPAINTALNHTFDADTTAKDLAKDAWNAAAPGEWSSFAPEIAKNLGILDGLDAACGDQFLADINAGANRYMALASILADDRLWVRFGAATCNSYLGVEAGDTDCGGRRLTDDVIDLSYTVLATGGFPAVTDGIAADPAKTGGSAFPYLSDPLP